ncbi:hypothetical protein [Cellulosimicrobium sp. Marseille-Q4280]|uniref:hypothetical protein n=1 Tax=Cellulosimicrobium sp. Marseille-Q4280 TaxID=2937992 RepID=UPI0020420CD4|nr:hypothetical protein [Cellulosimicrobium sp. Marseille-Q4280]
MTHVPALSPRMVDLIGADTPLPVRRVGTLANTVRVPRELRAGHVLQADLAALTSHGHRALMRAASTLAMLQRNGAHGQATVLYDGSLMNPRTVVVVDAPGVETRLVVSTQDTVMGASLYGLGGKCVEVGMLGHRAPAIDWAPGGATPKVGRDRLLHLIAQAAAPTAFAEVYGPEHREVIELHHLEWSKRGIAWGLSTPYGGLTVALDEYRQRVSTPRHPNGRGTWGRNRWVEPQLVQAAEIKAASAIGTYDLSELVGPAHDLAYQAAAAFLRAPARTVVE